MFARLLKVFVNGGAVATALATVLVLGSACKESIDSCDCPTHSFAGNAGGANVIPSLPPGDTSARASATFNTATFAYTYTVTAPPPGTIDSIALYQVSNGGVLPSSATVMLCAGLAACASTRKGWSTVVGGVSGGGTVTLVPPATISTITTSMRGYGTQLVFFTTTAQKGAGGAMRGTMYPIPSRCSC